MEDANVLHKFIKRYLKMGNYYPATTKLLLCKERLYQYNGNELRFYIDRSVQNQGSKNIEAIFGIMIYDENNLLIDTYYATIKEWITANKVEIMAFVCTLLIAPDNKSIKIFTDSQMVCDNFEKLKNQQYRHNLQDILKFANNNYL